ncbi:MAG: cell division protein FtsZ [Dehalococcoidia bacterium]
MTSHKEDAPTITVGRNTWLRFAMEASERWIKAHGEPSLEMKRFASYLREMRYLAQHKLVDLANELQVPYEHLAMLEQGLLKPSELPSEAWVRLVRLLEGREELILRVVEQQDDKSDDSDELWALTDGEDPMTALTLGAKGTRAMEAIGVARIKVIGIGGGGSNAVARMYRQRIVGVEYVTINTDAQHLLHLDVPVKQRIGDRLTRGLGVGGDPQLGREAAEESREELYDMLKGTDMVFIACGMGGGTGTGAAPVIAAIAQETGALTIAAVTKPFSFEGRRRAQQAEEGIAQLRTCVDTLILIPNDRLSAISDEQMTAENAFRIADDVLRQGVQSIAELVTVPGEINLDFADVRTVMSGAGPAWMAIGHGRGENRAWEAAKAAMASPLLDAPIEGATRVLLNITGGNDLTLTEVQQAADFVSKLVDPEANIIFGMVTDPKMDDEVRVTIIATGLPTGDTILEQSLEDMIEDSVGDTEVAADADAAEGDPSVEIPTFLRHFGFGRRKPEE